MSHIRVEVHSRQHFPIRVTLAAAIKAMAIPSWYTAPSSGLVRLTTGKALGGRQDGNIPTEAESRRKPHWVSCLPACCEIVMTLPLAGSPIETERLSRTSPNQRATGVEVHLQTRLRPGSVAWATKGIVELKLKVAPLVGLAQGSRTGEE